MLKSALSLALVMSMSGAALADQPNSGTVIPLKTSDPSKPAPKTNSHEQTFVLTLSSLRRVVSTQCQLMEVQKDAQQALHDALSRK